MKPPVNPELVAKVAVGPKHWTGEPFTVWEALLSDIITGNAFGADRMDYLLRDSLHTGVAYGRFDLHRLVQSLRILPPAPEADGDDEPPSPVIGLDEGGLHTAEALLLARYFMFIQVYFHRVRVIYDRLPRTRRGGRAVGCGPLRRCCCSQGAQHEGGWWDRRRGMMTQMRRLQRAAVLCHLAERLRAADSWCGETHLQKAAFLLEDARDVPLDYEFVLYKYGPFSFDLRDELDELRARGFMKLEPQPHPYGPRIGITGRGQRLFEHYPKTVMSYTGQVDDVVDFVGSRGVSALERLATAVYFVRREPDAPDDALAEQLCDVKPHVTPTAAADAIARARRFVAS